MTPANLKLTEDQVSEIVREHVILRLVAFESSPYMLEAVDTEKVPFHRTASNIFFYPTVIYFLFDDTHAHAMDDNIGLVMSLVDAYHEGRTVVLRVPRFSSDRQSRDYHYLAKYAPEPEC